MIHFLDLQSVHAEIQSELCSALERVLCSGMYVGGIEVEAFEAEWSAFTGAQHTVGVGNGLDALRLALEAVGVGPGDEVIVPSHTFFATWLAVLQLGATPVAVEPTDGYLMEAKTVALAITPRTKAVVPVHLYGQAVQLNPLLVLARRHGIAVVEDAAQAHGALLDGKRIGSHGDAIAWSFYPGKNLGALGDGGAVTTHRADIAEQVRQLRNYGSAERYKHSLVGTNSRLDALQAAVLRVKLARLPEWNTRRQMQAAQYQDRLIKENDRLLISQAPALNSVWHLFVICHAKRNQLQAYLMDKGIQTQVHYPIPCHQQGAYTTSAKNLAQLPRAEYLANTVLSLPIGPHLSTPGRATHDSAEVNTVCEHVLRWLDEA